MTEVAHDVVLARAYLSRVAEPANVAVWAFVQEAGPVAAVRAIRAGAVPDKVRAATDARRDDADPEADLAAAARRGIRLLTPESDDWPHFALAALERLGLTRARALGAKDFARDAAGESVPPLALWVRGEELLCDIATRSAGLVGARASTSYGNHVTAELSFGLARRGITVVSGGAYGIDAAAHRAALAAEGMTVLVSAGGLDRPYPTGNAPLFEQVAQTGLLVSESPPGCAPQRHRFLSRNRLIAAFSTGVVVIEASARSGATNTAGHARRQGRPLMAVPGPVTSPMSAGCHALLQKEENPALLVTGLDDVLAMVGPMGSGLGADRATPAAPPDVRTELDELDPLARRVFEGLSARRWARPEQIAARSGVGVLEVVRALPALDLAGLIEGGVDGFRLAPRLRARPGPGARG